ncbi:MAG TPA: HD domain-containing protein [Ktedonobacterales bacterium]|nr:HD domain-containing protein [Ktedonobacterales bacterium]
MHASLPSLPPLPFALETPLERAIVADPVWKRGAAWGWPRPGHAEGKVIYHVTDVLANVERYALSPEDRRDLRLIALTHDSLKFRVDPERSRSGENHHAARARRFAERYIDDERVLRIIELHDEGIHLWNRWRRTHDAHLIAAQVDTLLDQLGADWLLFVEFFRCDNDTPSKNPEPVLWFEEMLRERGYDVPPLPSTSDATEDEREAI